MRLITKRLDFNPPVPWYQNSFLRPPSKTSEKWFWDFLGLCGVQTSQGLWTDTHFWTRKSKQDGPYEPIPCSNFFSECDGKARWRNLHDTYWILRVGIPASQGPAGGNLKVLAPMDARQGFDMILLYIHTDTQSRLRSCVRCLKQKKWSHFKGWFPQFHVLHVGACKWDRPQFIVIFTRYIMMNQFFLFPMVFPSSSLYHHYNFIKTMTTILLHIITIIIILAVITLW